jgi:hypothetical protein
MPVKTRLIVTCGRCGAEHEEGAPARHVAVLEYPRDEGVANAKALLLVEDACPACYEVLTRMVGQYAKAYSQPRKQREKRVKADDAKGEATGADLFGSAGVAHGQ